MARKAMPMTGIPAGFKLTETTMLYVSDRFPTVDIDKTLERFSETCEANGTMYADWQAGFRTWVRRNVEEKWKGVVYKLGRSQDPAWSNIVADAKRFGFRDPEFQETPSSYRVAMERWKDAPKKAPVIEFGDHLKKMGS